jgi:hypothetical protein
VINRKNSPERKIKSAIFSNRIPDFLMLRIDRKDKTQLIININIAIAVSSSIMLFSAILLILNEVRTTKQRPIRVAEVFRICGDLLFCSVILYFAYVFRSARVIINP